MRSFAQNREDLIVLNYFNGNKGHLLDIGANDGETFSNSRLLIAQGWSAELVEPSPRAFAKLKDAYGCSIDVTCWNVAISTYKGKGKFYESANHVPNGKDVALVSSSHQSEVSKWPAVEFATVEVDFLTFADYYTYAKYDFISIDAEGSDWDILQQIDLKEVGCRCLCIEYNSKPILHGLYTNYVKKFGFKEIAINAENVIYAI